MRWPVPSSVAPAVKFYKSTDADVFPEVYVPSDGG